MPEYLKQRAAPWVSATVLIGGMMTSILLFWLVHTENTRTSVLSATGSYDSSLWQD